MTPKKHADKKVGIDWSGQMQSDNSDGSNQQPSASKQGTDRPPVGPMINPPAGGSRT
ncbi:hypothetical protein [Bacillus sp. T33-2]|uniref:hypothetical protein n=1 Tax=Bacillus sp. T33-2 TaxID=2054168 RepID=UPI0015E142F5|nr:hypothetical protein [Bacillus sp. T33-2]